MTGAVDVEALRKLATDYVAELERLAALEAAGKKPWVARPIIEAWQYIKPQDILALLARLESAEKERDETERNNIEMAKEYIDAHLARAAGFREGVEAAAKLIVEKQETTNLRRGNTYLTDRTLGNQAGLVFAEAIRALAPEPSR